MGWSTNLVQVLSLSEEHSSYLPGVMHWQQGCMDSGKVRKREIGNNLSVFLYHNAGKTVLRSPGL